MDIILLMRLSYYKYYDHIKTIRQLGINVHLISEIECIKQDVPLFKTVNILVQQTSEETIFNVALHIKEKFNIKAVITFLEPDIVLCAKLAEYLEVPGIDKIPAIISRDKNKQRNLLSNNNIPSPWFISINNITGENQIPEKNFPVIIKSTQASLSVGVYLANNKDEIKHYLNEIYLFAEKNKLHYHEEDKSSLALIEEFLPGEEVTLDGIVINGEFILGGIHNKRRNMGPTFEEDLYSLPFKLPGHEPELFNIAASICKALGLKNSMFNVELRQDNTGNFKVVEFSTRFSAGFCYRHIKAVYEIDLVALYCKSLLGIPIYEHEKTRKTPIITTCTKWVFGTGIVTRNKIGKSINSPYFEDYMVLAQPGTKVGPPHGLNCVGRISIKAPYESISSIEKLEQESFNIAKMLDVQID